MANKPNAAPIIGSAFSEPTDESAFIDFEALKTRLPFCERTARGLIRKGIIPSIKLPGGRRRIFDWPSVRTALLRHQRHAA